MSVLFFRGAKRKSNNSKSSKWKIVTLSLVGILLMLFFVPLGKADLSLGNYVIALILQNGQTQDPFTITDATGNTLMRIDNNSNIITNGYVNSTQIKTDYLYKRDNSLLWNFSAGDIPASSAIVVTKEGNNTVARWPNGTVLMLSVNDPDDSDVIQAAINAGNEVVLKGTFWINNTVNLKNNMHLIILKETVINAANGYPSNIFYGNFVQNVIVDGGGTFNGRWANTTDVVNDHFQNMIMLNNSYKFKVRDLVFVDAKGFDTWNASDGEVSGIYATMITNPWYPLQFHSGNDITIENNYVNGGGVAQHAIVLWSADTMFRVINNYVKNVTQYEIEIQYSGPNNRYYSDRSIVSSNIVDTNSTGIYVITNESAYITVTKNMVSGLRGIKFIANGVVSDNIIHATDFGIDTTGGAAITDVVISNNLITAGNSGINPVSRNTIIGNVISNATYGIFAQGSDLIISNNRIYNVTADGIYAYPANNSIIEGNIIENSSAYGIRIRNSNGTKVYDNIIIGGTTSIYHDAGSSSNIEISHNTLSSPTAISSLPSNSTIRTNQGYVTENRGASSLSGGGVIAHGLAAAPTAWYVFPQAANVTASATANSTYLTVNLYYINGTAVTNPVNVTWSAEV